MQEHRAKFPHCDSDVLHAPGKCDFCDMYPERQNARVIANVNYTGQYDPDMAICPSEARRSIHVIQRWHGNVPVKLPKDSPTGIA